MEGRGRLRRAPALAGSLRFPGRARLPPDDLG